MHSQVLVIYPKDVELDDVMYPYQEIDKDVNEKMYDRRCQFFLRIKEEDVTSHLNIIKEYFEKKKYNYLKMIQYLSEHSPEEFERKYGSNNRDCYEFYKYYCDWLNLYENIKDLRMDNPKQIQFIKEFSDLATPLSVNIYIKGKGYGMFFNPYQLWDYYQDVSGRFGPGKHFLISTGGDSSNMMNLNELDVNNTVDNINKFTYVWEHIIFCESNPLNSRIYTIDDIRFSKEWNEHCLVDDLKEKIIEIMDLLNNEQLTSKYIISAIDIHW